MQSYIQYHGRSCVCSVGSLIKHFSTYIQVLVSLTSTYYRYVSLNSAIKKAELSGQKSFVCIGLFPTLKVAGSSCVPPSCKRSSLWSRLTGSGDSVDHLSKQFAAWWSYISHVKLVNAFVEPYLMSVDDINYWWVWCWLEPKVGNWYIRSCQSSQETKHRRKVCDKSCCWSA